MTELENPTPKVYAKKDRKVFDTPADTNDITPEMIFNYIRDINDPEHPLTLEQLNVVEEENITINKTRVNVTFTPTIPHCSMSTLIGLSIRTALERSLPSNYKFNVSITPGSHNTEDQINKQLADKERVAAALENPYLLDVVNKCLEPPND